MSGKEPRNVPGWPQIEEQIVKIEKKYLKDAPDTDKPTIQQEGKKVLAYQNFIEDLLGFVPHIRNTVEKVCKEHNVDFDGDPADEYKQFLEARKLPAEVLDAARNEAKGAK